MTVLDENDESTGSFSNAGDNSVISTFSGRMYFEHQPAKNFAGEEFVSYSVDWKSPDDLTGKVVTFYGAANFANGNGSASNDRIVTFATSFEEERVAPLSLVVVSENISCEGNADGSASAQVAGGQEPYSYIWSTGETASAIENLVMGTYDVTVTDNEGTQAISSTTITEPDELKVSFNVSANPACELNNGIISALPMGGTAPYSFLWSDNSTTQSLEGIPAGDYSVTIVDANDCQAMGMTSLIDMDLDAPEILLKPSIVLELSDEMIVQEISFEDIDDGSIDNCGSFESSISKTSFDCDDLGFQDIQVTLTDFSGNQSQALVAVEVKDISPPEIFCVDELNIATCGNFVYTLPTASDNCAVSQLRFVSGLGNNSSFPIGTSVEIYEARDASGNAVQCQIMIQNEPTIDANIEITDVLCNGDSDGSITAEIMGNNPPFTVVNSEPGLGLDNLGPGFYTLIITDGSGCEFNRTVEVSEPDVLSIANVDINQPINSNSGDGSIEVQISGGTPPYEYEWRTEDEVFSMDQNLELLFPGQYQLIVNDANGCMAMTDTLLLDAITSVNDPELLSFLHLYPNPVMNHLSIDYNHMEKSPKLIEIIDLTGVIQVNYKENYNLINVSDLTKGLYYLKVTLDDDSVLIRKISKI